ncbi:protein-S-isoprenylcysteine O-methyltransferase Ste14 [Tamaricihabitans halophyticus]|uniref:Protein-S-isoprenylcysteine O-methyltransferase Ste14 n=1 Tax=Tamaricihabitans halophyticus TaxID=1262583 RepID=A0A4R2R669_9PSEU|nr:isoprenylcysteine carboxylmethyltransferase family protein [Tamaricihabitans halophyticus]TCP57318.1 protein-S-isoprenylcysteine O-methyltransferase Ste14 [Tamaricihabitans halophyticus]
MRRAKATLGSAVFLVAAPGTVAVLIPWLLSGWQFRDPQPWWTPVWVQVIGGLLIAIGAAGLVHAFGKFVVEGFGTPSPSAPPNRLVVGGLYRFVRNPMYVTVLAAILGQALLFGQWGLALYAAITWCGVAAFVRWREEPALARRFGADYTAYRKAVRAWWPRLRPWDPGELGPERVIAARGQFG